MRLGETLMPSSHELFVILVLVLQSLACHDHYSTRVRACVSPGITALEMAEGKPPYGDIHPMRAIFMIPTKPPPSFREPDKWQPNFLDFVSRWDAVYA